MKIFILPHESLDSLKVTVEDNLEEYRNEDNKWVEKQLGHNPFIEFGKTVEDFTLDPQGKEIDNAKILYSAMKNISDSEATDERLWVGMTHGVCWKFMKENLADDMSKNRRYKFDSNTVLNRYFYNMKANARKRSMYINTLSKMWWIGRLCFDDSNKDNPYRYLELFETAFSHKIINMFSSNILGNKNIRFAFFDTGLYIKSKGIQIKGDTMTPLLIYLNEIGGRLVLDVLERHEIFKLLVNFVDNNLHEIKNR